MSYTIRTRFNSATDTTGESVTAIAISDFDGRKRQKTYSYDYALGCMGNHDLAANKLSEKLDLELVEEQATRLTGYAYRTPEWINWVGREMAGLARYHQVAVEETKRGFVYSIARK